MGGFWCNDLHNFLFYKLILQNEFATKSTVAIFHQIILHLLAPCLIGHRREKMSMCEEVTTQWHGWVISSCSEWKRMFVKLEREFGRWWNRVIHIWLPPMEYLVDICWPSCLCFHTQVFAENGSNLVQFLGCIFLFLRESSSPSEYSYKLSTGSSSVKREFKCSITSMLLAVVWPTCLGPNFLNLQYLFVQFNLSLVRPCNSFCVSLRVVLSSIISLYNSRLRVV